MGCSGAVAASLCRRRSYLAARTEVMLIDHGRLPSGRVFSIQECLAWARGMYHRFSRQHSPCLDLRGAVVVCRRMVRLPCFAWYRKCVVWDKKTGEAVRDALPPSVQEDCETTRERKACEMER